jgi:hypothetical protein
MHVKSVAGVISSEVSAESRGGGLRAASVHTGAASRTMETLRVVTSVLRRAVSGDARCAPLRSRRDASPSESSRRKPFEVQPRVHAHETPALAMRDVGGFLEARNDGLRKRGIAAEDSGRPRAQQGMVFAKGRSTWRNCVSNARASSRP